MRDRPETALFLSDQVWRAGLVRDVQICRHCQPCESVKSSHLNLKKVCMSFHHLKDSGQRDRRNDTVQRRVTVRKGSSSKSVVLVQVLGCVGSEPRYSVFDVLDRFAPDEMVQKVANLGNTRSKK